VQFKEVFLTDDYLAIAMEYVPSGNLFQYVSDRNGLKVWSALPQTFQCGKCTLLLMNTRD
jgi:hypothetical protein